MKLLPRQAIVETKRKEELAAQTRLKDLHDAIRQAEHKLNDLRTAIERTSTLK